MARAATRPRQTWVSIRGAVDRRADLALALPGLGRCDSGYNWSDFARVGFLRAILSDEVEAVEGLEFAAAWIVRRRTAG